jgi:hypothetical protein
MLETTVVQGLLLKVQKVAHYFHFKLFY